MGCSEEKRIVDVAFLGSQLEFFFEGFECHGLWQRVGHVEEGGHAACRRRPALAFHVGFRCQSGLAEVHMFVDDTWQEEASCGIDGGIVMTWHCLRVFKNFCNASVFNADATFESPSFVDDGGSVNRCFHDCLSLLSSICHGHWSKRGNAGGWLVIFGAFLSCRSLSPRFLWLFHNSFSHTGRF